MRQMSPISFSVAPSVPGPNSVCVGPGVDGVDFHQLGDRLEHFIDGYSRHYGEGVPNYMDIEESATCAVSRGCSEPGCPVALPSDGHYQVTNLETTESVSLQASKPG